MEGKGRGRTREFRLQRSIRQSKRGGGGGRANFGADGKTGAHSYQDGGGLKRSTERGARGIQLDRRWRVVHQGRIGRREEESEEKEILGGEVDGSGGLLPSVQVGAGKRLNTLGREERRDFPGRSKDPADRNVKGESEVRGKLTPRQKSDGLTEQRRGISPTGRSRPCVCALQLQL